MKTQKEIQPCIHGDLGDCLDCNKPQHTPTPWKYENHEIWGKNQNIAEIHNSKSIFADGEPEANAEFIVRAVNSHEDLVFGIKNAIVMLDETAPMVAIELRKVLAKAEGK